jgi:hypothetical protein
MNQMKVITLFFCLILVASLVSAQEGLFSRISSFLSNIVDSIKSMISSGDSRDITLRHGDLFDFNTGRLDAIYPECDLEETPFAKNGQIQKAGLRTCGGGKDIAKLGAIDYDSISLPAEDLFESNPQAIVGNVYVIKTRDGGYVKLQVTGIREEREVSFRWNNLPGKWKTTTTTYPGGLVTLVLDVNTTVECNISMGYNALYSEYFLAYNNMTAYMASDRGDTPEAAAAYQRYRIKKACFDLVG